MIIAYNELGISVETNNYQPLVFVIENKRSLIKLVENIKNDINGISSTVVLSENENSLKITKEVELIIDPWNIDFNGKRIKTKLYQLMADVSTDQNDEEFLELRAKIFRYIENVSEHLMYGLNYNIELEPSTIFKSVDVGIENQNVDFAERVVEYIKLVQSLCNVKAVFLLNIKRYLSVEEIQLLYKDVQYNNIQLILIEDSENERICGEKIVVIDKDDCIIEL